MSNEQFEDPSNKNIPKTKDHAKNLYESEPITPEPFSQTNPESPIFGESLNDKQRARNQKSPIIR